MAVGLRIRGLVQGVGFRPTVWHIARKLNLRGDVRNDGDGVWVQFLGGETEAETFCDALIAGLPPLARIDEIERYLDLAEFEAGEFDIHHSDHTTPLTGIVPDAATCPACLAEITDPANRRYRYPFTNCTHCGPRLSIIKAIPYDRPNTSMAVFPMCPSCEHEYKDPADRRYHAQPNACGDCGPRVWIAGDDSGRDAFEIADEALRAGKIVALKGIGGFHLACDAHNADAVHALRERKRRWGKPFALMARDTDVMSRYCRISDEEADLLKSPAAPIVLLNKCDDGKLLPEPVALDHESLGFMLPYSPIHHLLLDGWDTPLVMTSGNLSDEPQCTDNEEANTRLHDIADCVLLHDREIVNRVDDSVVRIMADRPRFYRRARGYAPAPLVLHESFRDRPTVLALGGELKNTICLLEDGRATLSQHLGDLEDARTSDEFERTVGLYRHVFDFQPERIAVDMHPDYRSSRFGASLAEREDRELIGVQHHHAHIASVLAEQGYTIDTPPVLGIALDGLGYGTDGTIWGGEFLKADFRESERLARLSPVPMPGGTQAILEPWRDLWAQLHTHGLWDEAQERLGHLEAFSFVADKPLEVMGNMVGRGLNSPLTSSAGRLFDAVAASLGLHHEQVYQEGQAAIALEQLATQHPAVDIGYSFELTDTGISTQTLWSALIDDLSQGIAPALIARRFHTGFADAIAQMAEQLTQAQGLDTVVLSGGVFQNKLLLEALIGTLEQTGLSVLHHSDVPSNDGGLSLGQAAVAAASEM